MLPLSVCMIARDASRFLPASLASVCGVAAEVIVVDTGSSDGTPELAARSGARVLYHPWTGDFSAARNASLQAATQPWILVLDADEILLRETVPALREALEGPCEGYFVYIDSPLDEAGEHVIRAPIFRLFRNRPEHRFQGRVHEQIIDRVRASGPIGESGVVIWHEGYRPSARQRKRGRNLELIQQELLRAPRDPALYYWLGLELQAEGRPQEAAEQFERALAELSPSSSLRPLAWLHLVHALLEADNPARAAERAEAALREYPDYPDLHYARGNALLSLGLVEQAEHAFRACLEVQPLRRVLYVVSVGVQAWLPWTRLGEIALRRGDPEEAARCFREALAANAAYEPALRGYTAARQGALGVTGALVDLLRQLPEASDRALAGLVRLVDELEPLTRYDVLPHLLDQAGRADFAGLRLARAVDLCARGRIAEALAALEEAGSASDPALNGEAALLAWGLGQPDRVAARAQRLAGRPDSVAEAWVWSALLAGAQGPPVLPPPAYVGQVRVAVRRLALRAARLFGIDRSGEIVRVLRYLGAAEGEVELLAGKVACWAGCRREGLALLGRAVARGSCDAEGFELLADAFADAGRWEEAAECYARAIALAPTRSRLHVARLRALLRAGDPERVRAAAHWAMHVCGDDPLVRGLAAAIATPAQGAGRG